MVLCTGTIILIKTKTHINTVRIEISNQNSSLPLNGIFLINIGRIWETSKNI